MTQLPPPTCEMSTPIARIAKESQCGPRLPRNLMEILEEAPPKQKRHIA
jgi:hypothetical protein